MEELFSLGRETLEKLTEAELTTLWKRLRFFTYKNFAHKINGRANLDEVILDAIEDTYVGNRRLPPGVDLTAFLCQTVRSKVSHILSKDKNRIAVEDLEAFEQLMPLESAAGGRQAEEAYQRVAYKELCDQLRKAAQPDPYLIQLAELLFVTPDLKPSEIAVQMNQPVSNVFNLLRRLGRRARRR